MTPSEFGLNVIAGWLANKLDLVLKNCVSKNEFDYHICETDSKLNVQSDIKSPKEESKLFRTFDVYYDLEKILPYIPNPIAHILIEKEPSTHWNLACLVLESKLTEEWYVFSRDRMAMQGMGGGIRQSQIVLDLLRKYDTKIAAWAIFKHTLDEFEDGIKLWHQIKVSIVPLFSSMCIQENWNSIIDKTREMLNDA